MILLTSVVTGETVVCWCSVFSGAPALSFARHTVHPGIGIASNQNIATEKRMTQSTSVPYNCVSGCRGVKEAI